jgi:hypothetical protein
MKAFQRKQPLHLDSPGLSFVVMTAVLQNFIHVKSQPTPWHKRRLRMQAFVFFLL